MTRIGIIGLGYVGLPLAVAFAGAGDALLRADGAGRGIPRPARGRGGRPGLSWVELDAERLAWADCVIITTHHRATDLAPVVAGARRVVDLRNAVRQSLGGSPSGPVPANVDVL